MKFIELLKLVYDQSAHRGVMRVYISMGDRRGRNVSPEERGEGREKEELEE